MQQIPKEVLLRAICRGKFHQKKLMFGLGFFREWQQNPPLNGTCWIIDKDFQVRKEKCKIGLKAFNRAYKNYITFLNKKDALRTRALVLRTLRELQINLYATVQDFTPINLPCIRQKREKIEQLEIFDLENEPKPKRKLYNDYQS